MTEVPVSALTLRILQRDFHYCLDSSGVFQPVNSTILYYFLNSTPTKAQCLMKYDKTLVHTIFISDKTPIDPRNLVHIGLFLHKWAIDSMCKIIDHFEDVISYSEAINIFLRKYKIEEDDYSKETAYRTYSKWRNARRRTTVPIKSGHITREFIDLSVDKMSELAGIITARNLHMLYTSKDTVITQFIPRITKFLLYKHSKMTVVEIAKIYDTQHTAISKTIAKFQRFYYQNSRFRQSMEDVLSRYYL